MRKLFFLPAGFLVAASVLLVACGGSKADLPALATEAANVQPQADQTVVAKSLKFDTDTIVVPAGQAITLTLDNKDSGTLHNIAVYTNDDDKEEVYRGELFKGGEEKAYAFTAPEAGIYLFRCDAHPDMNGVLVAK